MEAKGDSGITVFQEEMALSFLVIAILSILV